jgi:hypothetical protein
MYGLGWGSSRLKKADRGQIRIIEAFLAVLIIFSAFAVSADLTGSRSATKSESLASIGLHSLMKLDQDGRLGMYITDGDFTALREALDLILPAGICFNLTVYDEQMQRLNTDVITNGGFNSQEVAFVEYICASQSATLRCYVIHVNLGMAT